MLNEFEYIGLLLTRSALDAYLVWSYWSDLILWYHPAARKVVAEERRENPTYREYWDAMYQAVAAVEREKAGRTLR
ncbi:MAG: hypothetical protein JO020_03480 [Chloroflexi bacterium]|nr:hypothetical protein [Chloroflexota bacterium]